MRHNAAAPTVNWCPGKLQGFPGRANARNACLFLLHKTTPARCSLIRRQKRVSRKIVLSSHGECTTTIASQNKNQVGKTLCRLYDHAKKVANKLEAARAAQAHPKDDATGAPFFAPVVGRAPTYARNHAALPIGDYLYGMRCEPQQEQQPSVFCIERV